MRRHQLTKRLVCVMRIRPKDPWIYITKEATWGSPRDRGVRS
jgi:hypothetical protein